MDINIDYEIIKILLECQTNLKQLDKILEEQLPEEIVKIIYQYVDACGVCKECCPLCEMYCYDICLRINPITMNFVNYCCENELKKDLKKYIKKDNKKTD